MEGGPKARGDEHVAAAILSGLCSLHGWIVADPYRERSIAPLLPHQLSEMLVTHPQGGAKTHSAGEEKENGGGSSVVTLAPILPTPTIGKQPNLEPGKLRQGPGRQM